MADDLEKLLDARQEIDRALQEHTRSLAVMFTDIVGSTSYFERQGDIAGMSLVKRHNKALFPLVEQHRGRVVKTIGDAIMAVFDEPADGVRCASQMQRALAELNASSPGEQPIHIRIGVHAGRVVLDKGDVYGDTVNTAARIGHEALGDEVLISQSLAELVPASDGLRTASRGAIPFKGKAEPVPVVSVLWGPGAPPPPAAQPAAAPKPKPVAPAPLPHAVASLPEARPPESSGPHRIQAEVFVLELATGPEGLRVAVLDGAADKGTVKSYQDVPLAQADLDHLAGGFGAFARGGSASYVEHLRGVGSELFSRALSERAKKHLAGTTQRFLRLQLDDRLVHLPWELLFDGHEFLGVRFAAGRLVSARSDTSPTYRLPGRSLKRVLVVSNPSGDLPAAAREGAAVAGLLREGTGAEVQVLEGPVTKAAFLAALARGADLIHFAGHAREGQGEAGGFQLADGVAGPEEVARAVVAAPLLVFANSCHASTGAGWTEGARGLYGLASALLMRGVQHYLGPMWEVPDEDALAFALRFYEGALSGQALGEAARAARQSLMHPPAQPTSFAGYVLYGDPRGALPEGSVRLAPRAAVRSSGVGPRPVLEAAAPAAPARGEPVAAFRPAQPPATVRLRLPVLGGAAAALIALVGGGAYVLGKSGPKPAPAPDDAKPPAVLPADPSRHTGPLRLSVLPFKNATGDAKLDHLKDALQETVLTDLQSAKDTKLIERGQLDLDIQELEFSQTKYVDPATRAQLGKIKGAEVVVMGAYQKAGETVRVNARLVDAESGEILDSVRVEAPKDGLLDLQDEVAAHLKTALDGARKRLRP